MKNKDKKILTISLAVTFILGIVFIFGVLQSALGGFAIVDVRFTGDISTNAESNAMLVLANSGVAEEVRIETETQNIQINPVIVEDTLEKELKVLYTLKTGETPGEWVVTFEACSLDEENRCAVRSIYGNVMSTITDRCGDNICQDSEDINSCAEDCDVDLYLEEQEDLKVSYSFLDTRIGKYLLGLFIGAMFLNLIMVFKIYRKDIKKWVK